jgi:ribosomal protein S18 acetylase RimI-like enzyme
MIVADWREADANLLRSCYDREAQHWQRQLGWDTEQTWSTIEEARVTWGLPGLLALDGSRVDGWAFYTRDGDILQLGGLVADTSEATAQILGEVINAARQAQLPVVSCFLLERAAELRGELKRRGFDIEPFLYLGAPVARVLSGDASPAPWPVSSWRDEDLDAAGKLLSQAYSQRAARHFAPTGTAEEWRHYLGAMVEQTACGVFDPHMTRVVRDARGMRALAFMTAIGPRTAHLAQMVVHPEERGRGLAPGLLRSAAALADRAGHDEITLLVGESNQPARHVYEALGFTPRATFVAARR